MNHRWSELLAAETITSAGTKTIEVDIADPISRLSVLMKLTNNGSTPLAHPALALTKLELLDGSDVLTSLSGYEIQALDFYHNRSTPFHDLIYLDNVMALLAFNIDFGRWLHDPELALDPKKFKNLQLKIQHSAVSAASQADSLDLRVRADVFDELQPSPEGFLMPKEIYSYLLVSSGNEYIDLPVDHPIRKLIVMSRSATKAPHEQFNVLKLSEETDKKVLIEGYTSDFTKILCGLYPQWIDKIFGNATAAGVAHFITPTYAAYPSLNSEQAGTVAIGCEVFANGGTKTIYGASTINFHGLFSGYCPHGAVPIDMGDQNKPDDWWDVQKLTKARLKITAGSSVEAVNCQVVTQQFRKY